jgi:hypothetical protein
MFCTMERATIRLFCHVTLNTVLIFPYEVSWFFNDTIIEDYADVYTKTQDTSVARGVISTLEIQTSFKTRDEGDYKCTVTDFFNNQKSKTKTVEFVRTPKVEIIIENPLELVTRHKNKLVTFSAKYQTCPYTGLNDTKGLVFMTNPKGKKIKLDKLKTSEKYKIEMKDNVFKFSIKNPEMRDFGNYTFSGSYGEIHVVSTLKLIVNGDANIFCEKFNFN